MFIIEEGLYCYKVMLFDLKNARVTYQRLVNKMFTNKIGRTMEVCVEDILVKSLTIEQHVQDRTDTFASLKLYNMKLNPENYTFRVEAKRFLGFMVS